MGDKRDSNGQDPNQPPADGPGTGGADDSSSGTGDTSQDKPGGADSDGKQSPN